MMTIIAVLVALLVPAVQMARSHARIAQCMNNQKQLALAIISYEGAKGHFPGYANNIYVAGQPAAAISAGKLGGGDPAVHRPPGFVGGTVEDQRLAERHAVPHRAVRVNEFVCPSDASNPGSTLAALSYAVNVGGPTFGEQGVFRDLTLPTAVPISMSNIAAPSRRPLITDNPYQAVRTSHVWQSRRSRFGPPDARATPRTSPRTSLASSGLTLPPLRAW